ncbi:uncharacterized protein LOC108935949 [Scleropages formosus]|uniref:Uncharacterized LOC108935949 n=1 Tax=Scleropages formosus TaxID=113540 RepID=A0A8C9T0B8_SCLFO|nr:uncharacterized protein LOC108935949 [Scleropages formosus]
MNSFLFLTFSGVCYSLVDSAHVKWTPGQDVEDSSSFYEDLWKSNIDIANATLQTRFLQAMQMGNLPVEKYTIFGMQDLYYMINVTAMLREMSEKKPMPEDIKQFFKGRFNSYEKYLAYLLNDFSLTNESVIVPRPAMASYINNYHRVMKKYEPIYFVVALLPCSKLWPYLAENVNMTENNPYYSFKRDNQGGNPAKHFKGLLDGYQHKMNKKTAHQIFRQQMEHEKNFFQSSYTEKPILF